MGNDLFDYKPNSHKSKAEGANKTSKKVNKVVKGNVRVKKKSELSKMMSSFISEDAKNVKSYILADILIPTIKKAIGDIFTEGISMILYGEAGHYKKSSTNASRVSYRDYYDDRKRRDDRGYRARQEYSYDEIEFDSRGEAENVLRCMDDLLDKYQMVSIGDFYDLVGITGNYTDNDYGWTSLETAEVVRARDCYIIRFPRVKCLK